jgi:hypothetical protein
MELAEQSPTSSAVGVNKLSCAIHSIQKSEQLPCSPHDAYPAKQVIASAALVLNATFALGFTADQTMIHSA